MQERGSEEAKPRGEHPSGPVLIYEAADSGFADAAIGALNEAGIEAYRTGGALPYGRSDPRVCIYIRHAADSERANRILLEQGAVVDKPVSVKAVLLFLGAFVAFALIAALVAGK